MTTTLTAPTPADAGKVYAYDATSGRMVFVAPGGGRPILNPMDPPFNAKGDGIADDTVALQAWLDASIGPGAAASTFRVAIASLFLPPGTYKTTAPLVVRSVMGFQLEGCQYASRIAPAFTGATVFEFNGMTWGRIGGFKIEGTGAELVDYGIHYYWDAATAARSSSDMHFHDIEIMNTRFKTGFLAGVPGATNQVDISLFKNINITGSWYSNQSETTLWQQGFVIGHENGYGNAVANTVQHLAVDGVRYGTVVTPCDVNIDGASFGHNEVDFYVNGITTLAVNRVRSEHSQRLITSPGAGTAFSMVSLANILFTGNDIPVDGRVVNWSNAGSFQLDNVAIGASSGWNEPVFRFQHDWGKLNVHLRGVNTSRDLKDLLDYVGGGPTTGGNGTTIRVDDYSRTNKANGSTSDQPVWSTVVAPSANAAATSAWAARVWGDTQERVRMDATGVISWGPGGTTAPDTNFYRMAASVLKTDGALEFTEQASDPAAPATNNARVYTRDNGSGKTQLCVRFPTGAVQVIATEP